MKLKLLSLHSLLQRLLLVLMRFPLESLFAALGTAAAIATSYTDVRLENERWIPLIMCANLGLVYNLSASTCLPPGGKLLQRRLLHLGVLLLLALYYFSLPEALKGADYLRFFLLAALGHLLVAVAPFWQKGHVSHFWHYNKALFLRFLTAVLYSVVLYAGLAVGLMALEELFGLDIEGKFYFRLLLVIAGIFNTLMFLSGIPEKPLSDEAAGDYPKSLKIFTQYVLIPLVSVYVLILLAYEIKILLEWDLPRGWVSNLIIAFAVFGILSLLLVYPVRNSQEDKWIRWYSKTYYWVMLPLLALLFLAIGKRIGEYGFTPERFLVLIAGCQLLFVSLYFLSGKNENIKVIPVSLIVITLVSLLLAAPLSLHDQRGRMLEILSANGMLKDGKAIPSAKVLDTADRQELTSITRYLFSMHGPKAFSRHFDRVPESPHFRMYAHEFTDSLLRGLGQEALYRTNPSGIRYFSVQLDPKAALPATGYDYVYGHNRYSSDWEFEAEGNTFRGMFAENRQEFLLFSPGKDSLRFEMKDLIGRMAARSLDRAGHPSYMSVQEASLERENHHFRARILLLDLNGRVEENEPALSGLGINCMIMISLKN